MTMRIQHAKNGDHGASPSPVRKGHDEGNKSLLSPVVLSILVTETGERFAYFGFRAVLVLYFHRALEYNKDQSVAYYAFTTSLAYFSPILGALLADGLWGRYKTILYLGVVYVMGLTILTVAAFMSDLPSKRILSFSGLFLTCLGTGGIKPCVSAFGADQVANHRSPTAILLKDSDVEDDSNEYNNLEDNLENIKTATTTTNTEDRSVQVRDFFAYFYFCINVGALTSISIIPILRARIGFRAAFLVPALFMTCAMSLFVSKRNEYVIQEPGKGGSSLVTTCRLTFWLLRHNIAHWNPPAKCLRPNPLSLHIHNRVLTEEDDEDAKILSQEEKTSNNDNQEAHALSESGDVCHSVLQKQLEDAAQALHVLPLMLMFPVFWALYDQQSSVWTLQAERMRLHGLQPEQLNIINPLEIMLFIPLFDRIIYPAMVKRHIDIAPLRRMQWGMFLTAVSFMISGWVESSIQAAEQEESTIDVFWQLPQITILAVAEIFVSVTGLEFAYATSPDSLKAFLMGIFFLTTAVGDFFSGILYSTLFTHLNQATVLYVCAALMMVNLVLFRGVVRWYSACNYHSLQRTRDGTQFLYSDNVAQLVPVADVELT